MKKQRFIIAFIFAVAICFGFSGCGSDDDETTVKPPYEQDDTQPGGGQGDEGDGVEEPSDKPEGERDENLNPQGSVASAVDLGLSVNWASHNIGAEGVYDAGGAYGWGDAQGTCYSKDNSYYPSANPPFNISGTTYDIAREKWGGTWRIPTATEFQELIDNCDVQWDTSLRVLVFTSKVNGRQLILPPTLYRSGLEYYSAASNNVEGHYWTSTLYTNNTEQAYDFGFYGGAEMRISYHTERHTGIAVRPVQTNPNYTPGENIPDEGEDEEDGSTSYTGTIQGHDYVDLGLSVKWATCNVGASLPEQYGNYFCWGRTETSWDIPNLASYVPTDISGTDYDAAHEIWGNQWKTPNKEQFEELIDNCTFTAEKVNGNKVIKATSKINGQSILFPLTGYREGFYERGDTKFQTLRSGNAVCLMISEVFSSKNNYFICWYNSLEATCSNFFNLSNTIYSNTYQLVVRPITE